ncbi:SubName: Full=Uncharacterized protein {ECO:0000313/EMBL:CCA67927.1} [Serendipita indica DSM 11827]|uniref:Uncharacterized protein n=1 Tax=Serendipita indica (strain DSM 11827) TaxID=1109443 RepID=G4T9F1_SERID|nr:SubName: Full=Uncharacterized protein {ECO:0000313/EMBL:CCA67927.1} [Serendipita indica DSM 11827]CCA67927.1 hypothetical protein PIIN_01796 [Serendipita indica DSM 11827]
MDALDAFQDYFWDFAQDHLPYQVYDTLYTFSEHLATVYYGLNRVFTWAYKSASGTQNVEGLSVSEQILPPLLSIIAIYFGLLSIYRTTASFIRTTIAIVKWGLIISLLAMGAGYFAGQGQFQNPINTGMLLRVASEFMNGQDRVMATPEEREANRGRSYGGRTRTQPGDGQRRRPSIFEPFLKNQNQAQAEEVQEYVKQVVDGAQKVYKDGSGFFDILFKRSADKGDGSGDETQRQTRSQTRRPRRSREN